MYQNTIIKRIITPYKKLRDYNGLKCDYVADVLGISTSTLHRYESGCVPIPKGIIKRLDEIYGCNGKLISYWLTDNLSAKEEKEAVDCVCKKNKAINIFVNIFK